MKTLTIKNYFLIEGSEEIGGKKIVVKSLNSWLLAMPLHGKDLRLRNRFIRATRELGQDLEDTRKDLLQQYGKKDANGNLEKEYTAEGESYAFNDKEAFLKEWSDFTKQDVKIELTPELWEAAQFIKDLLLKAIDKENFVGRQSVLVEEWADAFEAIKEDAE